MSNYKNKLGGFGEEKSCQYLVENGYKILTRNFRCRAGEIDIIAMKDNFLVFVEVKTRSSVSFGMPSEAVNYIKQEKYFKTALHYIRETGKKNIAFRFDVMEVMVNKGTVCINHIIDAYRHIRMKYYL